jgi:hypothetical protein
MKIDTANGAVNRFFARPTIPDSVPLFPGLFQAKFHISNWTSLNAPNAPWTTVPGGAAVLNGMAPATNDGSIEFDCPANTGTTTCGIPTPSVAHQAVYVELMAAPGQVVPFTTAAAYREMDFTSPTGSAGTGGAGGGSSASGGAGGTAGGAPRPGGGSSGEDGRSSSNSGAPNDSGAGGSAGTNAQHGEAGDTATNNGGAPGDAGATAAPPSSGTGSSCGCRVVGRQSSVFADLIALLVVGVSLSRRRRARRVS